MGIGDWGLGIGDWGLGPIPNPQSPSPIFIIEKYQEIELIEKSHSDSDSGSNN